MAERKWSNSALRRHLGERGFIEVHVNATENSNVSDWERGTDKLTLVEAGNNEPVLYEDGYAIDPESIGYRNINVQNDEGRNDR